MSDACATPGCGHAKSAHKPIVKDDCALCSCTRYTSIHALVANIRESTRTEDAVTTYTAPTEIVPHRIEIGDHTVIDGTDSTQTRILGDTLEDHEVNLRQLWRDLAAKGISDGVDYPRIVTTLFGDLDRLHARIETANNLLKSWEHDAPDLVPDIWYNRIRTALGLKKNG